MGIAGSVLSTWSRPPDQQLLATAMETFVDRCPGTFVLDRATHAHSLAH